MGCLNELRNSCSHKAKIVMHMAHIYLKARSHILTRLNCLVGSVSVGICDRGLQQQSGHLSRQIRRVGKLEMSKINDLIVGSWEGQLVYVTPLTTRHDGPIAGYAPGFYIDYTGNAICYIKSTSIKKSSISDTGYIPEV